MRSERLVDRPADVGLYYFDLYDDVNKGVLSRILAVLDRELFVVLYRDQEHLLDILVPE